MDTMTMPQIGEKAPEFQAQSTHGTIRFPEDFKGKWVVLLSHPGAFHPVCASEFQALASMQNRFAEKNCALLAFSPDSSEAHAAWMRELGKGIPSGSSVFAGIPLVSDDGGVISRRYGVLRPGAARPMRGVFFIDTKGIVRAVLIYPHGVGRNTTEILRLLLALQAFDTEGALIPANWLPADWMPEMQKPVTQSHPSASNSASAVPIQQENQAEQMPKENESAVHVVSIQPVPQNQPEQQTKTHDNTGANTDADQADVVIPASPSMAEPNPSDANAQKRKPSTLRPVSQSVWDALAEAQPQVSASQPVKPDTVPPVSSFLHTQGEKPVAPQIPSSKAVPASQTKRSTSGNRRAGGTSIADQNRLLLGNLLDKEDAENGNTSDGKDYLMMRDFPYSNK